MAKGKEPSRRVALVTGGAKRVGRAIVEHLADRGFDVAFTYYLSGTLADDIVNKYEKGPARIVRIPGDLDDPATFVPAVVGEFQRHFNRLDVLVNNASAYEESPLETVKLEDIRRFNAVHVESPLLLCQAFAPMLRKSRGHVVNMIDLLAERPWPKYLAYCASKAALDHFTRAAALDCAPKGVRVNAVNPGVVITNLHKRGGMDDARYAAFLEHAKSTHPLGRPGTAEEVADLIAFLLSEKSEWITGETIAIDGGRHLTCLR